MKKHPKKKKEQDYDEEIEFKKVKKFELASTEYERKEIFKSILADSYKIVALAYVPESEKTKYLQYIKSAEATMTVINQYDTAEKKREALTYVTTRLKGNADKYLELLSMADFGISANPEIPIIKLNNLRVLNIDMLSKIQKNVQNYEVLKFKLNEKIHDKNEYSFHEMCAIMIKLQELTSGIDPNASEKEKFSIIYERMTSTITYDNECLKEMDKLKEKRKKEWDAKQYDVAFKTNEEIIEVSKEAAGLYGGLVNGKAICSGYSLILHEALQYIGIKSKYIIGYPPYNKINSDGHAWNQVKIDGKWYNVDSTWDASVFQSTGCWKYALLDDKSFEKTHGRFSNLYSKSYPCTDCSGQLLVPKKNIDRRDGGAR